MEKNEIVERASKLGFKFFEEKTARSFETSRHNEMAVSHVKFSKSDGYESFIGVEIDPYYDQEKSDINMEIHLDYWEHYRKENGYNVLFINDYDYEEVLLKKGFKSFPEHFGAVFAMLTHSSLSNLYYKEDNGKIEKLISYFRMFDDAIEEVKKQEPAINCHIRMDFYHLYYFGHTGGIDYEINEDGVFLRENVSESTFNFRSQGFDELVNFLLNIIEAIYKKNRVKNITKPPRTFFINFIRHYFSEGVLQDKIHDELKKYYEIREIENESAKLFATLRNKKLKNKEKFKPKLSFSLENNKDIFLFTMINTVFLIKKLEHESFVVSSYSIDNLEKVIQLANEEVMKITREATLDYLNLHKKDA